MYCNIILTRKEITYIYILHFTFLFSLFAFVSAAGHYFRIWTGHYFSICKPGTCIIILDKKYNIANSSCHFGSPKKYYMDIRSFGPYNIFWVTDRSIYCHMTLSAMNYLLYISCAPSNVVQTNLASVFESYSIEQKATKQLLTAVPPKL
jgi:hypothetical protein